VPLATTINAVQSLTFNILLDAAMPTDLHLPPTSDAGGGLACELGPNCQLFG